MLELVCAFRMYGVVVVDVKTSFTTFRNEYSDDFTVIFTTRFLPSTKKLAEIVFRLHRNGIPPCIYGVNLEGEHGCNDSVEPIEGRSSRVQVFERKNSITTLSL